MPFLLRLPASSRNLLKRWQLICFEFSAVSRWTYATWHFLFAAIIKSTKLFDTCRPPWSQSQANKLHEKIETDFPFEIFAREHKIHYEPRKMSILFEVGENCRPKNCLIFDISTKKQKKRESKWISTTKFTMLSSNNRLTQRCYDVHFQNPNHCSFSVGD